MDSLKILNQFTILKDMASLINSSLEPDDIREKAIEVTMEALGSEAASLLLLDEQTGELYFDVVKGEKGEKLKQIQLQKGEGIAGWVALHKEPVIAADPASDPRFFKGADEVSGIRTRNILCVPVCSKDRMLGVLEAINRKEGDFDQDDLEIMKTLANDVAVAIENARLYTELWETFYTTIEMLADIIELRDPYTGGHTRRVHNYCVMIANQLQLSKNETDQLRLAAILHDIGKVGVSDQILLKPGQLTEDEFKAIEGHSTCGSNSLRRIKKLRGLIPGIRNHHERYDGTGYPDKLFGKNIPLMARIIGIADAFDAMTTDRPYRKGFSPEEAMEELSRSAGGHFDPELVITFKDAWEKDLKSLEP